jgi:hypothetical protein
LTNSRALDENGAKSPPRKRELWPVCGAQLHVSEADRQQRQQGKDLAMMNDSTQVAKVVPPTSMSNRKKRRNQKRRAKKRRAPATSSTDPFQLIGQEIHRHVLSYLMCLRDYIVEPAKSACKLFMDANRASVPRHVMDKPNLIPDLNVYIYLSVVFERDLTDKDRSEWNKRAKQDEQRYPKEMAALTTSHDLRKICQNLCVVS